MGYGYILEIGKYFFLCLLFLFFDIDEWFVLFSVFDC